MAANQLIDRRWDYFGLAWSFWSTALRFTESAELREVPEESELVLPVEAEGGRQLIARWLCLGQRSHSYFLIAYYYVFPSGA